MSDSDLFSWGMSGNGLLSYSQLSPVVDQRNYDTASMAHFAEFQLAPIVRNPTSDAWAQRIRDSLASRLASREMAWGPDEVIESSVLNLLPCHRDTWKQHVSKMIMMRLIKNSFYY